MTSSTNNLGLETPFWTLTTSELTSALAALNNIPREIKSHPLQHGKRQKILHFLPEGAKPIQEEIEKILELRKTYGEWFCSLVHEDTLLALQIIEPEQVELTKKNESHFHNLTLSVLGEHAAVRGSTKDQQPFVAIKIASQNKDLTITNLAVEVLFMPDNTQPTRYAVALFSDDAGSQHHSYLCPEKKPDSMTKAQIERVKELLQTVPIPIENKGLAYCVVEKI
jgi:hypothetical protein